MKKFLKKFLKKLLKILVIILGLFVAYYIFCLIRANLFVGDLAKAMEYNRLNDIEELTGENFFGDHSINDFYVEYIYGYEHVESYNKDFSYNKLGMKPYYHYILFEYEISYPDPLWLLENSKDAQEIIDSFHEEHLTAFRKSEFLINYFGEVYDEKNIGYSKFLLLVEDWCGNHYDALLSETSVLNLENIMNVVNQEIEVAQEIKLKKTKAVLAYNIFTNKFETDGIFYYAARGFLTPQEIVFKSYVQRNDSINEVYSVMSLSDGSNEINCRFYKDDLIWLKDVNGENEEIEKQNIYFIKNNIKKDEILEVLAGSGYEEIEEVVFYGDNKVIDVEFCKNICLSPENLKGLSREVAIERLKSEGFVIEQ